MKKFLYIIFCVAILTINLHPVGTDTPSPVFLTLRHKNKLYSASDIEMYKKIIQSSKDFSDERKKEIITELQRRWDDAQKEARSYLNTKKEDREKQEEHLKAINESLSLMESIIDIYALQKLPTNVPSYKYGIMLAAFVGLGSAAYLSKGYVTQKFYEKLPLLLENPIIKNVIKKEVINILRSPGTYKTLLLLPFTQPIIKQATEQLINNQISSLSPFD